MSVLVLVSTFSCLAYLCRHFVVISYVLVGVSFCCFCVYFLDIYMQEKTRVCLWVPGPAPGKLVQ